MRIRAGAPISGSERQGYFQASARWLTTKTTPPHFSPGYYSLVVACHTKTQLSRVSGKTIDSLKHAKHGLPKMGRVRGVGLILKWRSIMLTLRRRLHTGYGDGLWSGARMSYQNVRSSVASAIRKNPDLRPSL